MTSLTQTLRTEHAAVMLLVDELRVALRAGQQQAVSDALTKLKDVLLAHLRHEDELLYPGLIQMAQGAGDPSLESTGKAFQIIMERITAGLEGFLAKYEGKPFELAAFEDEWNGIVELLAARVTAEEKTLYAMYDRAEARQR